MRRMIASNGDEEILFPCNGILLVDKQKKLLKIVMTIS